MPAKIRSGLTFSLLGLLGLVTLAGVAFAALKSATPLWSSAIFSAVLAVNAFAVLGARLGKRRRYWAGFALFGWGYLALIYGPGLEHNVRPRLVTTQFLAWGNEKWHGTSISNAITFTTLSSGSMVASNPYVVGGLTGVGAGGSGVSGSTYLPASALWTVTGVPPTSPASPTEFEQIGHSLFALLAACCGGIASAWLWRRDVKPTTKGE